MSRELLNIVEAVANEKEVDRSVIIEALEAALAAATRKRYPDEEIDAKVVIDPRSGEYKSFRVWTIVDDEAILENPRCPKCARRRRYRISRTEPARWGCAGNPD